MFGCFGFLFVLLFASLPTTTGYSNVWLNSGKMTGKGIEATLKLATSPNAKVVVIGGGDEGLPIILGNN